MKRSAILLATAIVLTYGCGGEGASSPDDLNDVQADVVQDAAVDVPADVPLEIPAEIPTDVPADLGHDDTVATDLPGEQAPADIAGSDAEDIVPTDTPWVRPAKGEPVSDVTIAEVTDLYIQILKDSRYFEVVDERLHGWPQSDPEERFWYGTWWSGVRILKESGKVTYKHSNDGADNNGMRTAPYLSGAAFARLLWNRADHLHVVQSLVRGFSSWVLAMQRTSLPDAPALMTRAAYFPPVTSTDGGREIYIDYSPTFPGIDGGASVYVRNADNPIWGDMYIKNLRSKDDIGHMLLAMAMAKDAVEKSNDPGLTQDWAQLMDLYGAWARRVELNGWQIETVDKDWNVYLPLDDLAILSDFYGVERTIMLALHLVGGGQPTPELDCGNGVSEAELVFAIKPDNAQQIRSYHEAAVAWLKITGHTDTARLLVQGLAQRVDTILDAREGPEPPAHPGNQDLAELVLSSATVGLPLTWREVRFMHDRIRDAHASYLAESAMRDYKVFDVESPDGEYSFTPDHDGLFHRYVGAVLGLCSSPFLDVSSNPVLDCDKIKAAFNQ